MNRSPFASFFHNAVASRADDWLAADRLEPLARKLRTLARGWRQGQPVPALLQSALEDDVSPIDLADALDWCAANLTGPQQLHSSLPAWVQFAQAHRDSLPFQYVPDFAEAVLDLLLPDLPIPEQNLVERFVADCHDAADQFQLRHAVGSNAVAIGEEVSDGLAAVLLLIGEDLDEARMDDLPGDIGRALSSWSACSADMGVAVDLELIRNVIGEVVATRRLSPRAWTLVMLRLERALAARAPGQIDHPLADVMAALLAACSRFGFLADMVHTALPYLPPARQQVGDFAIALMVARQAPDGRLGLRIATTVKLLEVAGAVGPDEAEIIEAVRLSSSALRATWERNYIDEYGESVQRFLQWAATGRWMLGVDHGQRGAERIAIDGIQAATIGEDSQIRVSLLRQWIGQSPFTADVAAATPALARLGASGLPASTLDLAASALAALDLGTLRAADAGAEGVAALVAEAAGDHAWARRILQRHDMFVRTLGCDDAIRRLQGGLARRMLSAGEAGGTDVLAALDAVARRLPATRGATAATRAQTEQLTASLLAARTAVGVIAHADAVAIAAADHVVEHAPDYARRIGTRVHGSIADDNRYTLARLAAALCLPPTRGEWELSWWWSNAIGSYLAVRDEKAMIANLAGLAAALRVRLSGEEAALARRALFAAYRNALGIDIPYSLTDGDAIGFLPFDDRGPLWRRLLERPHRIDAHHRATSWARAATPALAAIAAAADDAVDAGADLYAAWSAPGVVDAALSHDEAANLAAAVRDALEKRLESAEPVEAALDQVMATAALERIAAVSLARALAERGNAVIGAMATAARDLPETPPNQASEFERKGRRDVGLLLARLREDLAATTPQVAKLNAARYLVEALIPFVGFGPGSWLKLWTRALETLLPGIPSHAVGLAMECFALFAAITSRIEHSGPAARNVFARRDPVFTGDPELEAGWRALAGGLIVAACAEDAGHAGLALAQQAALSAPILDPAGAAALREGRDGLVALIAADWPAALEAALTASVEAMVATCDAQVALDSGGNLSMLDLTVAARSRDPAMALAWRLDRGVLAATRGLSTPMPGDHAVCRAAGWLTPDMITIRRLRRLVDDAVHVCGDVPGTALGVVSIASWTALCREGGPFTTLSHAVAATLDGAWSGERADAVQSRLVRAADAARRELEADAELPQRLAQAEQSLLAAVALRTAVALDWRAAADVDSNLIAGLCTACLTDAQRQPAAATEDAGARRRLGDLLNSHLSSQLSARQINLLIATLESVAA